MTAACFMIDRVWLCTPELLRTSASLPSSCFFAIIAAVCFTQLLVNSATLQSPITFNSGNARRRYVLDITGRINIRHRRVDTERLSRRSTAPLALHRQIATLFSTTSVLIRFAIGPAASLSRACAASTSLTSGKFLALLCGKRPYLHHAIRLSDSESPGLCALKEANDLGKEVPRKARIEVFDGSACQ